MSEYCFEICCIAMFEGGLCVHTGWPESYGKQFGAAECCVFYAFGRRSLDRTYERYGCGKLFKKDDAGIGELRWWTVKE